MIVITPARRPAALVAALALAAVACGGDDGGGAEPDTPTDPAADDVETADDGGDVGDAASDGSGDAAGDAGAAGATGEPSTLLADELHPLDLPEPGTAVVRLAGETYEFDTLNTCGISESDTGGASFVAIGNSELADGTQIRFDVSRYIVAPEAVQPGTWHERDFLQMTVEQSPGEAMYSNAIHDVYREEVGGPISGDGDVLPVIRVIDDGGTVAATGVAEVTHPPFTGDFDRAGEGVGEFAVVCE